MDTRTRHSETDAFFRDLALCVATHRAGGPAMVWPADCAAVVAPYDDGAADGDGPPGSRAAPTDLTDPADPTDGDPTEPATGPHPTDPAAGPRPAADASAVRHPADARMREMADRLGTFVGRPVHAGYWSLRPGASTAPCEPAHDTVLVQLAGACECRASGPQPATEGSPTHPGVRVRLRAGEALYVARSGSYALSGVHSACTVVELRIED